MKANCSNKISADQNLQTERKLIFPLVFESVVRKPRNCKTVILKIKSIPFSFSMNKLPKQKKSHSLYNTKFSNFI